LRRSSSFSERLPHQESDACEPYGAQSTYEQLIRAFGPVTAREFEALQERLTLAWDPCELLNPSDSVRQFLGIPPFET
jgi:hypothetical protein